MDKEEKSGAAAIGTLSMDDVQRLFVDRSATVQMDIVERLADLYSAEGHKTLNPKEKAIAEDIFRLLLVRADLLVRATLAAHVSQASALPPELARKMAADVSEVAIPVLQYSGVLSDDDLIEMIDAVMNVEKLQAIARRATVSEKVSQALVNTSLDPVVNDLVHNAGASIAEVSYEKIVRDFSNDTEMMESLFVLIFVPQAVIEKVFRHVSENVRRTLEEKYGNLAEMSAVRKSLEKTLEHTAVKMREFHSPDKQLAHMLSQLSYDRLIPLAALVMGNQEMFEMSLSQLVHMPPNNVHMMIQDPVCLKAVYAKGHLPEVLFDAAELALNAIRDLGREHTQQKGAKKEYGNTQRLMERMRQISGTHKVEGVEHFYALMQHCAPIFKVKPGSRH